jgi:chromosomal replication initiator protein
MTREEAERRRQAEIEHREVTLAAREAAMNEALGLYAMGAPKRPTARQILSEVSQKRGIPVADIVGPWRRQDLVEARHEAAYRMRTETMMSFPLIGRAIGGRDHTTVLHGYRRHAARLAALAAE